MMVDIHQIIADHRSFRKKEKARPKETQNRPIATMSEIPDIFFDQILVEFKLTRMETMVLIYLYRRVWCRPNLFKKFGISQLMSLTEMGKGLGLEMETIYNALRKLEEYGFISTIRSGQYFVRRYFTKVNDELYHQTYDEFES